MDFIVPSFTVWVCDIKNIIQVKPVYFCTICLSIPWLNFSDASSQFRNHFFSLFCWAYNLWHLQFFLNISSTGWLIAVACVFWLPRSDYKSWGTDFQWSRLCIIIMRKLGNIVPKHYSCCWSLFGLEKLNRRQVALIYLIREHWGFNLTFSCYRSFDVTKLNITWN